MKPLYCILGCSGSGKSTICSFLEKEYGLKQIPSFTTRLPRYENETGHTFVSEKTFSDLSDALVAYAETTGAYYGVTAEQINNEDYELYVVDFTGLKSLKEKYKGERKIISIYIDVKLSTRYSRLHDRYVKEYVNRDNFYSLATDMTLRRIIHDSEEFVGAAEYCDFRFDNEGDIYNIVENMIYLIDSNYL